MNERQRIVLRLLKADLRRDLYEGAAAMHGKTGSGRFWVTHTADEEYEPLTRNDISELLKAGAIRRKWEDCDGFFILTTPNVEVQRDSGGIIAGGSAGTTG